MTMSAAAGDVTSIGGGVIVVTCTSADAKCDTNRGAHPGKVISTWETSVVTSTLSRDEVTSTGGGVVKLTSTRGAAMG